MSTEGPLDKRLHLIWNDIKCEIETHVLHQEDLQQRFVQHLTPAFARKRVLLEEPKAGKAKS